MEIHRRAGPPRVTDTTDMIRIIRREFPSLQSRGQHDALEFLHLLMDRLKPPWNIDFAVTSQCFLCTTLNEKNESEPFLQFSLRISDSQVVTLSELLHYHLVVEECLWKELSCEIPGHSGYKEKEITAAGNLLVLALARYDAETRSKDHRPVQVEKKLFIAEHLQYRLVAMMCHQGHDFRVGHYTAWVHHHGHWFECSDETVLQHDDISDNPEVEKSCVIFFYKKCSIDVIEVNAAQEFVLTPAQDREVDQAFNMKRNAVVAEVNSIQVRGCDIQTLKGDNWLNDIVIDAFMLTACNLRNELIRQNSVCSISVLSHSQWCKELNSDCPLSRSCLLRNMDFSRMDKVLIPMCINGNHWCLLVLDRYEKSIRFYDPLIMSLSGTKPNNKVEEVRAFLSKRDAQLGTNHFEGIKTWAMKGVVYQLQQDASSCGVFVCLYAMQECGIVAAIDQIDTRGVRRYIAFRLLENKPSFRPASGGENDHTIAERFHHSDIGSQNSPKPNPYTDIRTRSTVFDLSPEDEESLSRNKDSGEEDEQSGDKETTSGVKKRRFKRIIVKTSSDEDEVPRNVTEDSTNMAIL
ncbi:uncharacterized protein LOC144904353 [Branchiostoma floridae x Branchiostoma belcheri]